MSGQPVTSSQFVSMAASGADWREAAKNVLEALERVRTEDDGLNFGWLYITDLLAADAQSILTLFRSVTGVENWVGCVGTGIFSAAADAVAGNHEYVNVPAISVLMTRLRPEEFCIFPAAGLDTRAAQGVLRNWKKNNAPMLAYVHGDPDAEDDPAHVLAGLDELIGGFLAGGISSSQNQNVQFAGEITGGGLSGAVFAQSVEVATCLSQGCRPLGPEYVITRARDNVIRELDGKPPLDLFSESIKTMVRDETGEDSDQVHVKQGSHGEAADVPLKFKDLFKKEIHAAFPIPGRDRRDYMVRPITNIDTDTGAIEVAHSFRAEDKIMFVCRDDQTVRADLSRTLLDFRKRVTRQQGGFAPKGGIYISCAARAFSKEGDYTGAGLEMELIREIIGEIPLTGFYAGGEISGGRLYGFSGLLILFL